MTTMHADIDYLLKIESETLPVHGNLTIGRHIDNDVIVAGEDVLDFHLRLELGERGPQLIPLANATFALNGREVEGAWGVIPGDVIGIGAVSVQVGVEREQADDIHAWVLVDQDTERVHDIAADLLIGRHPECGLQLESEHVSRRHARVVQIAGALWIQDLASANGTQVNGRSIRGGCRLFHGDEVRFDEIAFRVRAIGENLTVIRPFRDEDLRPLKPAELSRDNDSASGRRELVPRIESSIEKRGLSQRSATNTAAALQSSAQKASQRSRPVPGSGSQAAAVTSAGNEPMLELQLASGREQRFPLAFGRSRIGAAAQCELRLDHAGLAPVHAEITLRPEETTLTTVEGIGRTRVNGMPAMVHTLADGDRIVLGEVELIYRAARPRTTRNRRWPFWLSIVAVLVVAVLAGATFI